ncbi:NUDIX domain-containing protein [Microbacterium aoyamense]|uniref:NUDIX domain-containing protein n=1 Tax=Microbacterium aoyamense TaxID=344166 RepID=A0ABN2P7R6_9MICO|nr:NUDIX domain-containing protein [Microbacterium aoyamense]
MTYRDSAGRALDEYPRPSVAADTAVLTVADGELCVLLVMSEDSHGGEWRLPGTFLHPGERLTDAVHRALREKAGITGLAPRQLHVFDAPDRDDRGWVLSVAHVDAVPPERLVSAAGVSVVPVADLPALKYDHAEIVGFAVEWLRERYRETPDPAGLLTGPFTLRRLRQLHETVLGEGLLPDSFRRAMLPGLQETGATFSEGRGRPAELYVRIAHPRE